MLTTNKLLSIFAIQFPHFIYKILHPVREILSELAIENKEKGEWKLKPKEAKLFND